MRRHGFRSLIVVTSAYHMPRAMAELGHQLPGVKLIAFPVVTEKMRNEQWWSHPATTRLLISEYAKFILAMVRMRVSPDARALAAGPTSAGGLSGEAAVVDWTAPQNRIPLLPNALYGSNGAPPSGAVHR